MEATGGSQLGRAGRREQVVCPSKERLLVLRADLNQHDVRRPGVGERVHEPPGLLYSAAARDGLHHVPS